MKCETIFLLLTTKLKQKVEQFNCKHWLTYWPNTCLTREFEQLNFLFYIGFYKTVLFSNFGQAIMAFKIKFPLQICYSRFWFWFQLKNKKFLKQFLVIQEFSSIPALTTYLSSFAPLCNIAKTFSCYFTKRLIEEGF